ncbi:unnamed protein product [Pleuronectes platessa]|uniref:Uncharacterized protein n=1 Tax=Pleuronectes platessa TaxID=8262 RepID=A0A9N7YH65_PLEPL|nr:unnamed protein product [Pleuronectes platessa]
MVLLEITSSCRWCSVVMMGREGKKKSKKCFLDGWINRPCPFLSVAWSLWIVLWRLWDTDNGKTSARPGLLTLLLGFHGNWSPSRL